MKLLLLATFVAVCSASSLYQSKTIAVNDNGIILISSPSGRLVTISRTLCLNGGRGCIEITCGGPSTVTKRIQFADEALYGISRTSSFDVLYEILGDYQGTVDEVLYERLLGEVGRAARGGLISREVFDLLVILEQIDDPLIYQKIEGLVEVGVGKLPLSGRSGGLPWFQRGFYGYGYGGVGSFQSRLPGGVYGGLYGTRQGLPVSRYYNPLLAQGVYGGYGDVPTGRGLFGREYLYGRTSYPYLQGQGGGLLDVLTGGYVARQPVIEDRVLARDVY